MDLVKPQSIEDLVITILSTQMCTGEILLQKIQVHKKTFTKFSIILESLKTCNKYLYLEVLSGFCNSSKAIYCGNKKLPKIS